MSCQLFLNSPKHQYIVPKECIDKHIKGFKLAKYIACGSGGCVFLVCDEKEQCNYVAKIILKFSSCEKLIPEAEIAIKWVKNK